MRYSHLKTEPLREFSHKRFDGGLNTYNSEDLILDNQMSDGANLLFKNGVLSSRKGLSFNTGEVIGAYDEYGYFYKGLTVTDTELLRDGELYRIAYTLWGDDFSYQKLYVYMVSPNGKLLPTGNFNFSRTSFDIYYSFSNIIFLVGSVTKGCGLYAFLNLKSGDESSYVIYELSSDYSEWLYINEHDLYIPVVQMNGKGNKYLDAATESDFSIPHITKPENYNMLTSRFKAYFATDGYSTQFQLPAKKISDESSVFCRMYISQSYYYEWLIPVGKDSATVVIDNNTITMCCYRYSGTVAFFDQSGNYFPLPRSYIVENNNLLIEATGFDEPSASDVMGCTGCQIYNSNVFFYGNQKNPSNIYVTTRDNPLYFPEKMKTSVGNPSDMVTAMAVQNNKLIAFKNSEVYQLSIKKEESELLSDSLVGSEKMVFENKQINVFLIHDSIGCISKKTVSVCGNRLVWLSNDAKVYTLATTTYGKENNIYCMSSPIENILSAYSKSELLNAFSFEADGYYALYIAQSIYMLNYRIKNFGISHVYTALGNHNESISWYVIKLPYQKYYSGYFSGSKMYLVCGDVKNQYCVLATLCGEVDKVLRLKDNVLSKEEIEIESCVTTKYFNCGLPDRRKNIEEVYISMDFIGEADIILNDGIIDYKQTVLSSRKNCSPIRIAPHFKGVYGVSVTVSSKNPISFKGVYIRYKNLV